LLCAEASQCGSGLHQATALQFLKNAGHGVRRPLARVGDLLDAGEHDVAVDTDLIKHEIVRCPGLDAEPLKVIGRKVPDVGCHDDLCGSPYRRGKHVVITWVSQLQALGEVLISGHHAVSHSAPHELAEAIELLLRHLRMVAAASGDHLLEDFIGPLSLNEVLPGDADEEVSLRISVQRVASYNTTNGIGLVLAEIFGHARQIIDDGAPMVVVVPLIVEQIAERDAAMRPNLRERDLPGL